MKSSIKSALLKVALLPFISFIAFLKKKLEEVFYKGIKRLQSRFKGMI